jgi:hypothetical protein
MRRDHTPADDTRKRRNRLEEKKEIWGENARREKSRAISAFSALSDLFASAPFATHHQGHDTESHSGIPAEDGCHQEHKAISQPEKQKNRHNEQRTVAGECQSHANI